MSTRSNASNRSEPSDRGILRGRRGASVIEWLLILPVFLLVVLGGYEIWNAVSIRESLRSGTYQATRYLSLQPETSNWGTVAREIILLELSNNTHIGYLISRGAFQPGDLSVSVIQPQPLECDAEFPVSAQVSWRPTIPFWEFPGETLSPEWAIRAQYRGHVVCVP